MNAFAAAAFVVLLAVAVYMARSHINSGRGDRRAATRIAAIALLGQMITWVFNDPHPLDPQVEIDRLFTSIGEALFAAVLLYVLYLALEPIMRRHWPDSLLGWSRLVQGRIVDPRVGRDVLIGIAAGGTIQLLITAQAPLQAMAGQQVLGASLGNLRLLDGPSYAIGLFSSLLSFQATFNAMWVVVAIVGLKRVLKRMWLVGIVATAFLAVVAANGLFIDQPGLLVLNIAIAVIVVVVLVTVVIRFGLLAAATMFLTTYTLGSTPWSLDTGRWDFPAIAVSAGLLLALIVFGGWAARAHARA